MIRFLPERAPSLVRLSDRLAEMGYADAVRRLCGDTPVFRYRHAMRDLRETPRPAGLADQAWAAVSLFFLGRASTNDDASALLSDGLEGLLALGMLASAKGEVLCDRCGIVPIGDALFVVSRLMHERSEPGANAGYLGHDTMELLSAVLAAPKASVLEVGCGTGIVGVMARLAEPGRRVVGTELCEEAVELARINAAINGVSLDVRLGDLYEPAGAERFDLIVADPPSVAVPDDLAFPLYGTGGSEGDRLLRRIVQGCDTHLSERGRLFGVTELQGSPGELPFVRFLGGWAGERSGRLAQLDVMASRHLPPDYHQSLGDHLSLLPGSGDKGRVGSRFAEYAAGRRLYFGYWIRLSITRLEPPAASHCTIRYHFSRATADSCLSVAANDTLVAGIEGAYGQHVSRFNPAFQWFVSRVCEGRTPAELAREFTGAGGDRATDYFVELATALGQLGLVRFDRLRGVA